MKALRQTKILELIQNEAIGTQELLAIRLREAGFDTTQATVSRDIRELMLQKMPMGDGGYRYVAYQREFDHELDARLRTILEQSVVAVDVAKNIVVIKTLPGLAMAALAAVDNIQLDEIVGTLAGDDTGIVILRTDSVAASFQERMKQLIAGNTPER